MSQAAHDLLLGLWEQGERIDQLGPEPGTAGLRLAELRLGD